MLEKAATMKRLEYSSLDKELKAPIDLSKKPYQKLGDAYKFDEIIQKKKPAFEK